MITWALSTAMVFADLRAGRAEKAGSTLSDEIPKKPFWDLGNMTLAFVMLWAYMTYSQYMIIWSGNKPDEITWYLARRRGGWFWVAIAIDGLSSSSSLLLSAHAHRTNSGWNALSKWRRGFVRHGRAASLLADPAVVFARGLLSVHWLDFTTWIGVSAASGLRSSSLRSSRRRPHPEEWLDQLKRSKPRRIGMSDVRFTTPIHPNAPPTAWRMRKKICGRVTESPGRSL